MSRALIYCIYLLFFQQAHSQHLYGEALTGMNKTNYGTGTFSGDKSYLLYGARVAAGLDHVQIGVEYRNNLTNPSWEVAALTFSMAETYYGAFIRAKISKYPARRFGLVVMVGAGRFYTTVQLPSANPLGNFSYDPITGFNGGAGFSIPLLKKTMIELAYKYNYLERPDLQTNIVFFKKHQASYHSFQLGLSYNVVFGKRSKEYQLLERNSILRKG